MKVSTFLLIFVFLVSFSISGLSQQTAMDFTQDDCEGTSHQLYSELDAGKVVILEFVMLNCAPCIVGTTALESIIKPYNSSHPGRVRIYSYGFLNSYTCEQIVAWKNDNNFTHPVFNNGEDQVNYYGGMGMPTIVVVGTNEHKVFYKSIGYLPSMDNDIRAAIDSALLYNPTGISETISSDRFKIYPTVVTGNLNIDADLDLAGYRVQVADALGRIIISGEMPENGRMTISAGNLPRGVYFVRLTGREGSSESVKLIRE